MIMKKLFIKALGIFAYLLIPAIFGGIGAGVFFNMYKGEKAILMIEKSS